MNFGDYIRQIRIKHGLTLREAARRIDITSPYLSQIEAGLERPPSLDVLRKMAVVYEVEVDDLLGQTKRRAAEVYGTQVAERPALQALFKIVRNWPEEDIIDAIRAVYKGRAVDLEEILREIRRRNQEDERRSDTQLPRLTRGRDGLFAADVVPRRLSKAGIAQMALRFLTRHGAGLDAYRPPTRIEHLVDREDDIRLLFDDNLAMFRNGQPLELGRSHWSAYLEGVREIHINAALDADYPTSQHRLRFTLGHELFHCLEHLMLMGRAQRTASVLRLMAHEEAVRASSAETRKNRKKSFVERWIEQPSGPKRLCTDEDWREWQADYFAACVLMPEWSVRQEVARRLGPDPVVVSDNDQRRVAYDIVKEKVFDAGVFERTLSEVYDVSKKAMTIRLMQLGLVRA